MLGTLTGQAVRGVLSSHGWLGEHFCWPVEGTERYFRDVESSTVKMIN